MKAFIDFAGHGDLAYSMHVLLEQRLGYELYHTYPGTSNWVAQKMKSSTARDIHPCDTFFTMDGYDTIYGDPCKFRVMRFEEFKDTKFDLIVNTRHFNEIPLYNLTEKYHPNAKFIRQIANLKEEPARAKNVLMAIKHKLPEGVNRLIVHPEHRLHFKYAERPLQDSIKSFANQSPGRKDFGIFLKLQKTLKDFTFKVHGLKGSDGFVPNAILYKAMQDATFVWHLKGGCCGYTGREALSCGRPLIINKELCKRHKTLANDYLVDLENCIDINNRSFEQVVEIIKEWSKPDVYLEKSKRAAETFSSLVSFEKEAEKVEKWIDKMPTIKKGG